MIGLQSILKHLPGKHDQRSHGRGRKGAPAPLSGKGASQEIDISNLSKDAKQISLEQAMSQADHGDIRARMAKNLKETSGGKVADRTAVSGKMTDAAADTIAQNMKNELKVHASYLAGDTMSTARDYVDSFKTTLSKGIKDGSLKNVDAKYLDALAINSVRKLMHQEVESNRQAFTDHGIRHIVGNTLRQKEILRQLNPKATGRDELMADFIMTNHDVGYTVPLIREGGLRGVMMTKNHPAFSEKIVGQQEAHWNRDKIFSKQEYDSMRNIIKTHDTTTMDIKNPLATSARISDNLSLFNKEKLPGMFEYVKGGDKSLVSMGLAAGKNDTKAFEKAKKDLYSKIDSATLSPQLKRDLKSATKEITYLTPKFTLGVLGGEISKIGKDGGRVTVEVKYNAYDTFLQKYFDMGQKQTKKFLEDYGIKDFNKTEYDVGDLLKIKVTGVKQKSISDLLIKGGPGSGNFGHSGRPGKVGGSGAGAGTIAPKVSPDESEDIYVRSDKEISDIERTGTQLFEDIYHRQLDENEFMPGGKYAKIMEEHLGGMASLSSMLDRNPDVVHTVIEHQNGLSTKGQDWPNGILPKVNKFDVQEKLYAKLKNDPDFQKCVKDAYPFDFEKGRKLYSWAGTLNEQEYHQEATKRTVRNLIDLWASTSGDTDPDAIAMQAVANRMFGDRGKLDHLHHDRVDEIIKTRGKGIEKFLQAQYDSTQEYLKNNNIHELVLYRGHAGKRNPLWNAESAEISLQPLSSFSLKHTTAAAFADSGSLHSNTTAKPSVMATVVKANRIFALPNTGFGCTTEQEAVVVGGPTKVSIFAGRNNTAAIGQLISVAEIREVFPKTKAAKTTRVINIDADLEEADWPKEAWDLPEYGSDRFEEFLSATHMTHAQFRKLPVYKRAVAKGEIKKKIFLQSEITKCF